jgi:4-diphosphocytidyl-2-C-methyl-D-erythritol kinase
LRFQGHESILVRYPVSGETDIVRVYNYVINGQNIVLKVLKALREQGFPPTPLEIDINKTIPPGTGLGAGSGNAAALIVWARSVYSREILKGTESSIGADIPFLAGHASLARVRGIGDKVEPVGMNLSFSACVLIPKWRSNTREAYRSVDERMNGCWLSDVEAFEESEGVLAALAAKERIGLLPNDFLPGLLELHPEYKTLFGILEGSNALAWGLSGSGSALFALFAKGNHFEELGTKIADAQGIERILFWE